MFTLADWNYYHDEYKGIVIASQTEFSYFIERAGDELALFKSKLVVSADSLIAFKRCSCRIADILFYDFKSSKYGQKVTSESVSGYYTASFSVVDEAGVRKKIDNAIMLYLSRFFKKIRICE